MTTVPFKTTSTGDIITGSSQAGRSVKWDHLKARLKVFAITYVVLMVAGLAVVVLIPSRYRSQAVVQLMNADGMPRTMILDAQPYRNAVMSDEVFKAAAERLAGKVEPGASSEYGTVRMLARSVTVSVDTAKGCILVTAESGNPEQAAACANAVAGAYVELEKRRAESSRKEYEPDLAKAAQLKKQVSEKEKTLHQAEDALKAFDAESRSTVGNENLEEARTELNGRIAQARTELEVAESQAKSLAINEANLKEELARTPEFQELPAVTIGPNPARTDLMREIAQEERELSEMLKRYTERYPAVIEKRAIVEQKKADLAKMEQKVSDTETRAKQPNPVYLQVKQNYDLAKLKLEEANGKVAQLRTSLQEAQGRLAKLDDRARTRTQLASTASGAASQLAGPKTELSDCQDRLSRLEGALVLPKVSEEAARPTLPSGPERGWWTAVVFLTAVVGATAATFGAGILDSSFESAWEIEQHLKVPVLGRISRVEEPERRRRRWARLRLEVLTSALLGAGVAAVVLLFMFETQIHGLRMLLFGN